MNCLKMYLTGTRVRRGDWSGAPANIIVENNGAVVYVESSLTMQNPVFCSQIVTEYINAMFLLVIKFKIMIAMLLNLVHGQVQKS